MSPRTHNALLSKRPDFAVLFAALGDETRLSLVSKLAGGRPYSISELTEGGELTRQAVTKHLRVLEKAGLVRSKYVGRQTLFTFDGRPFRDAGEYLQYVSKQWDSALGRLRAFVER